ncbi:MAG: tRNA (N6-threonylcarbamoyladenosine(37)-N6)-methyltransferase TrmO [Oscillospiraceae bacterium]|nr:tRNA (N6-threonylcarbamoyladenosine(37)-N6)-methyltransferase TrmO [Oscillospiraceae bacterium]MBQ2057709.1 tRNA (N6-threonylcarbamoyladenosine(37)-N6)-methyltransferase TrmO [Oscillospiraceae bacterium]MBQ2231762.1 tRNA (N6-threonylcarbamoyladenosine(37)-N6)-methyltransferase TrmO [Oscillospiraceae bacterium]MBQ3985365.1 tRNA (N6-threonylcarbamoyladenosine(37)-N6)-methyltransferase TrmO [Oscillospiraceae bacterium]MBQ5504282.1 tRNA (N6-threonylcarbamoyladenosine(37)-N6)-methyltransferase Tr
MIIEPIAYIRNDFTEKFGIPRQAGLAEVESLIVFEPGYRDPAALRGIEGFSHLWLIWGFSEAKFERWSPTVRPPRLGGNKRLGVFATRSPFRPNSLGLSSVRLSGVVDLGAEGLALSVLGADLMNGTPVYDIKPYLAYTDSHPDALGGFTDSAGSLEVEVRISDGLITRVPEEKRAPLLSVLAHDPRPTYQDDPAREYGMSFGGMNVKFKISGGVLTVTDIERTV